MWYALSGHDALVSLPVRAAFMHHAEPSGMNQPHRIGTIHECSPGELLARAAFMHHDHEGHNVLKHYAASGEL